MVSAGAWLNPDADGIWSDEPSTAVDALLDSLLVERTGVVLAGTQEDRRAVVGAAIDRLRSERPVYQLHGSPFIAGTRYGALSILLARSDLSPEVTWYRMTRVLGEFLSPEGADPAVVILSHPQLMDRDSITVLAQLAHQGRVTLLVHCDRTLDLPADLGALARARVLAQVTVRPLTPAAARVLLADHLGGPVSRVAATVLWSYGGGHVGRLRSIADDCVAAGKLRRAGDHWVLGTGPMPAGGGAVGEDLVQRRMSGRRRELLDEIATRGSVQVGELVAGGDGAELDVLQTQGIVRIRTTPDGRMVHVQPMWRDRVRGALVPDRRRELERQAAERDGLRHLLDRVEQHLTVLDLAGALELLEPVTSADPLTVAEALTSAEPGAAKELGVGTLQDATDAPTGTDAATGMDRATHTAGATGTAAQPVAQDVVRAHLVWVRARALLASGDLAAAHELVERASRIEDPCLVVLAASVASLRGDQQGARRRLESVGEASRPGGLDPRSPGRNRESVRLCAETTRAEVLALSDDQDGARRSAAWVDAQMSTFRQRGVLDTVMAPYDRATLAVSLVETHLACGDLDASRALAEALLDARHGNPEAVLYAELVVAAIDLLAGRLDVAGDSAEVLAAQSDAVGDPHASLVARALARFCRAANEPGRGVPAAPGSASSGGGAVAPAVWGRLGWFAAVLGPVPDDAGRVGGDDADRLGALAELARGAGLDVVELYALLSAAMLGSDVAGRLHASSGRTQSALSVPSADLAESLLGDDPAGSCLALSAVVAAGYLAWHQGGTAPLAAGLPAADARRLADLVTRHQEPTQGSAPDLAPAWMLSLTPREREIARLVADGHSNAAVARQHVISVRTVEGHLNQVYAKLGVRGRPGLIRIAAGSLLKSVG